MFQRSYCRIVMGMVGLLSTATLNAQTVSKTDTAAPKDACCREGNLLFGKQTTASSEESSKQNFASKATDGILSTRWCANGGSPNEWIQVDMEKPQSMASIRLHWEQEKNAYRYKVDVSKDAENWTTIIDQSRNRRQDRIVSHDFEPVVARYVRVVFLGSRSGSWGSLFECEAYAGKLPPLPESASQTPVTRASVADVKAPAEMEVRMFATPPEVNYPVCLTASVHGEVFVGVDEQGSLGKKPGGGRILKCVDTNGDGKADRIQVFAKVDHPRGLVYDQGQLWVLHPPFLSLYTDRDLDGVADESKILIEGISTDQVNKRGADHTTNGIRMGIDGWIYIAVGDFGFNHARGADGRVLSKRGGGIVRVRPDGGDMEIYAWGLRNVLDVSIDPYLNMFTRDNTNDGGGWNVRVTHILQGAQYGYPSLYKNFADELMPTLADYGGGSGCGSMFLHDPRWPKEFGSAAYTCDWGTSKVYRHRFPMDGPTFKADQDVFLDLPRPTDIDIDGSGRMYVSSWKDGGFDFTNENVGFVAQIIPRGFIPAVMPDLTTLPDSELAKWMSQGIAVPCLHVQRELLRRGNSSERMSAMMKLAADKSVPLAGRVAAIFTLKQWMGSQCHATLLGLAAQDDSIRSFALRALTDRLSECKDVPIDFLLEQLSDSSPQVRAQALISIARWGQHSPLPNTKGIADRILPLTSVLNSDGTQRTSSLSHELPDAQRVIPHLAVNALVTLNAWQSCIDALDSTFRPGALWALRQMHTQETVSALIQRLYRPIDPDTQAGVLEVLARLYFREGDYTKGDWWGTRPDTTGPYYDRQKWDQSDRIEKVLRGIQQSANDSLSQWINTQLQRHRIAFDGSPIDKPQTLESQSPIVIASFDPKDSRLIGNMDLNQAAAKTNGLPGNADKGKSLFTSQSCIACHTFSDGQTPKGPHLADIGKRYSKTELLESILKPNAKIAQGFESWQFLSEDGKVYTGFVVLESAESITIRQSTGIAVEIPRSEIEERKKQESSLMPKGLVDNLTPEQLADLIAYLQSL
jgi:putative membrane-bound dehydrogenase-like protein